MKLGKIEQAQTKTGKTYYKLTIDGKAYTYFNELNGLSIGDDVVCTFEQNGQYTNLKTIAKDDAPVQVKMTTTAQHDIVIQRTEKPHSYEFGKPNNRHKIYYNEVDELVMQINLLKNAGLLDPLENASE